MDLLDVEAEDLEVPEFQMQLFESLFELQQENYMCDTDIHTADGVVKAHKIILIAGSIHLKDLMTDLDEEISNVDLSTDRKDHVELVVRLLYTGRVLLSEKNAQNIADLCDRLDIPSAADVCRGFLFEKKMYQEENKGKEAVHHDNYAVPCGQISSESVSTKHGRKSKIQQEKANQTIEAKRSFDLAKNQSDSLELEDEASVGVKFDQLDKTNKPGVQNKGGTAGQQPGGQLQTGDVEGASVESSGDKHGMKFPDDQQSSQAKPSEIPPQIKEDASIDKIAGSSSDEIADSTNNKPRENVSEVPSAHTTEQVISDSLKVKGKVTKMGSNYYDVEDDLINLVRHDNKSSYDYAPRRKNFGFLSEKGKAGRGKSEVRSPKPITAATAKSSLEGQDIGDYLDEGNPEQSSMLTDDKNSTGETDNSGPKKRAKPSCFKCRNCKKTFENKRVLYAHKPFCDPDEVTDMEVDSEAKENLKMDSLEGSEGGKELEGALSQSAKHKMDSSDSNNRVKRLKTSKEGTASEITQCCERCGKVFKTKNALTKHQQHSKEVNGILVCPQVNYPCRYCNESFDTPSERVRHRELQHPYTLNCSINTCTVSCQTVKELIAHKKAMHPDSVKSRERAVNKGKVCKMCFEEFVSLDELKLHREEVHPNGGGQCEECGTHFKSWKRYLDHMNHKHDVPYDERHKPTVCTVEGCNYVGLHSGKFKQHMKSAHSIGTPRVKCKMCGKLIRGNKALQIHIRNVHEKSKGLSESTDDDLASQKGQTGQHDSYHGDEKKEQLTCHLCSYNNTEQIKLSNHLLRAHGIYPPENVKIFKCAQCDFITLLNYHFKCHMEKHEDSKVECPICDKMVMKNNFEKHLEYHNKVMYDCPYEDCQYSALAKTGLDKHIFRMHTHKDFKPYHCPYCEFRSKEMGNLKQHIKGKHKTEVYSDQIMPEDDIHQSESGHTKFTDGPGGHMTEEMLINRAVLQQQQDDMSEEEDGESDQDDYMSDDFMEESDFRGTFVPGMMRPNTNSNADMDYVIEGKSFSQEGNMSGRLVNRDQTELLMRPTQNESSESGSSQENRKMLTNTGGLKLEHVSLSEEAKLKRMLSSRELISGRMPQPQGQGHPNQRYPLGMSDEQQFIRHVEEDPNLVPYPFEGEDDEDSFYSDETFSDESSFEYDEASFIGTRADNPVYNKPVYSNKGGNPIARMNDPPYSNIGRTFHGNQGSQAWFSKDGKTVKRVNDAVRVSKGDNQSEKVMSPGTNPGDRRNMDEGEDALRLRTDSKAIIIPTSSQHVNVSDSSDGRQEIPVERDISRTRSMSQEPVHRDVLLKEHKVTDRISLSQESLPREVTGMKVDSKTPERVGVLQRGPANKIMSTEGKTLQGTSREFMPEKMSHGRMLSQRQVQEANSSSRPLREEMKTSHRQLTDKRKEYQGPVAGTVTLDLSGETNVPGHNFMSNPYNEDEESVYTSEDSNFDEDEMEYFENEEMDEMEQRLLEQHMRSGAYRRADLRPDKRMQTLPSRAEYLPGSNIKQDRGVPITFPKTSNVPDSSLRQARGIPTMQSRPGHVSDLNLRPEQRIPTTQSRSGIHPSSNVRQDQGKPSAQKSGDNYMGSNVPQDKQLTVSSSKGGNSSAIVEHEQADTTKSSIEMQRNNKTLPFAQNKKDGKSIDATETGTRSETSSPIVVTRDKMEHTVDQSKHDESNSDEKLTVPPVKGDNNLPTNTGITDKSNVSDVHKNEATNTNNSKIIKPETEHSKSSFSEEFKHESMLEELNAKSKKQALASKPKKDEEQMPQVQTLPHRISVPDRSLNETKEPSRLSSVNQPRSGEVSRIQMREIDDFRQSERQFGMPTNRSREPNEGRQSLHRPIRNTVCVDLSGPPESRTVTLDLSEEPVFKERFEDDPRNMHYPFDEDEESSYNSYEEEEFDDEEGMEFFGRGGHDAMDSRMYMPHSDNRFVNMRQQSAFRGHPVQDRQQNRGPQGMKRSEGYNQDRQQYQGPQGMKRSEGDNYPVMRQAQVPKRVVEMKKDNRDSDQREKHSSSPHLKQDKSSEHTKISDLKCGVEPELGTKGNQSMNFPDQDINLRNVNRVLSPSVSNSQGNNSPPIQSNSQIDNSPSIQSNNRLDNSPSMQSKLDEKTSLENRENRFGFNKNNENLSDNKAKRNSPFLEDREENNTRLARNDFNLDRRGDNSQTTRNVQSNIQQIRGGNQILSYPGEEDSDDFFEDLKDNQIKREDNYHLSHESEHNFEETNSDFGNMNYGESDIQSLLKAETLDDSNTTNMGAHYPFGPERTQNQTFMERSGVQVSNFTHGSSYPYNTGNAQSGSEYLHTSSVAHSVSNIQQNVTSGLYSVSDLKQDFSNFPHSHSDNDLSVSNVHHVSNIHHGTRVQSNSASNYHPQLTAPYSISNMQESRIPPSGFSNIPQHPVSTTPSQSGSNISMHSVSNIPQHSVSNNPQHCVSNNPQYNVSNNPPYNVSNNPPYSMSNVQHGASIPSSGYHNIPPYGVSSSPHGSIVQPGSFPFGESDNLHGFEHSVNPEEGHNVVVKEENYHYFDS